jgi:hypothetical protein
VFQFKEVITNVVVVVVVVVCFGFTSKKKSGRVLQKFTAFQWQHF